MATLIEFPIKTKPFPIDTATLGWTPDGKLTVVGGPGGGGAVDSVNGKTGAVVLGKSDVGLSSVDNTSDAAKPISTATAAALSLKQDSLNYANQAALHAGMDARFARIFTSMPAGTVGADGDYGILNATGYRAVLITKTAGSWGVVSESFTFAQMQAIASPAVGMTVFCTTIDWGGGITYPVDTLFRYDGTAWKPLFACCVYKTSADTATITNTQTSFQASLTLTPPVNLFALGRSLRVNLVSKIVLDGTPTYSPQVHAAGAALASSFANVDKRWRGYGLFWTRSANRLTAAAGATSLDLTSATSAPTTQATAFNGSSVTMQFGATFSATGADTSMCYEHIELELVP